MTLFSLFKQPKELTPMKTSPGKLTLFKQCGMKYKFIHVQQKSGETGDTSHLELYKLLQNAIQSYQKKLLYSSSDISATELADLIQNGWSDQAFATAPDINPFRDAAAGAGQAMTRWFATRAGTLMMYRNKPALGVFGAVVAHPVNVWCRLDRIERLQDNTIRVVNFKSGAREMHPRELASDLSARLQAAAARELFGADVKRFAMVFLRTGNMLDIPVEEMRLDELTGEIHAMCRRIQNEDFQPQPGPLCSVCEFMPGCPGWKQLPWKQAHETREAYSRRLRLSYSKMSLFERCARAYHKLYEERIPPKPQPFFSFGSCIHAVMETFYDKDEKHTRTLEFLLELLDRIWPDFRAGYRNPGEEALYLEKAKDMLEKYYYRFVHGKKFAPAAAIERYFEIPVGTDSVMTGFIDRIDKHARGGHMVLDYKTEPTDRSQDAVDSDLQLTLYYWASEEFLKLRITELGLFMMSHDKLMTTTRTKDQVPELLDRITAVTQQIRNETEFAPKINKYCMSCDHLAGCPLEEEILARPDLRTMEFTETDDWDE